MKESFYFPHDQNARGDDKIIPLLIKMGWEGYGMYWALVEKLYESGGRLQADYTSLAYDMRADADKVKSLCEDFRLFFRAGGKIGSKAVDSRLAERREKIRKARQSAAARWGTERDECDRNANASKIDAINKEKKERKKEITTARGADAPVDFSNELRTTVGQLAARKTERPGDDFGDYRLPAQFGRYGGAYVVSLSPADCASCLRDMRPGPRIRAALEWRIRIKSEEVAR